MKRLMLLLLFLPLLLGAADKPKPLSESVDKITTKSGELDRSELGYVGARCAALYLSLASYLAEAGRTKEESEDLSRSVRVKAEVFLKVAMATAREIKMTDESLSERVKALTQYYTSEMAENKRINNSVFTAFITDDLDAAKGIYPLFVAIAEDQKPLPAGRK